MKIAWGEFRTRNFDGIARLRTISVGKFSLSYVSTEHQHRRLPAV